jgi:hypothetical protein
MSYQDDLKRHLVDYKRRYLDISEPGVFQYRGREVPHDHILPLSKEYGNLLEEAQPDASAFLAKHPNKRHPYFHHLNSSQAFAFNLFFPYFNGGSTAASALLRAFGQEGELDRWEPEAVLETDEESNIDVHWIIKDGAQTFCEVKLSESDFGKAADDDRHRTKLKDTYCPVLAAHLGPGRLESPAFFDAYQFNRNVWHMVRVERSCLIFLLPRSNDILWKQLKKLLLGVVPRTRRRISTIAVEDVIANLIEDDLCPKALRQYAEKLKRKYLVQSAP